MITFRKYEYSDLQNILKWLKKPHVKEYWYSTSKLTDIQILDKYTKRLNDEKVKMYVIEFMGTDIGVIQTYFIDDLQPYKVQGLSKGLDLYIGEESFINKGIGTELITKFLQQFVFDSDLVINACIDPEVRNKRAIRAYEKVGYEHTCTCFDSESKLLTYYMVLKRENFSLNSK